MTLEKVADHFRIKAKVVSKSELEKEKAAQLEIELTHRGGYFAQKQMHALWR